jgi:hypothetical protein
MRGRGFDARHENPRRIEGNKVGGVVNMWASILVCAQRGNFVAN